MIDIAFIRENPEKVKKGVADKQHDPAIVDTVLQLDEKRRELIQQVEALRSERNKAAQERDRQKGKEVKEKLKDLEPQLTEAESAYLEALHTVPNLPADDVPVGKDESENVVVRTWGEPRKFDFTPRDHLEIGESMDIIDTKTAADVVGARFTYLKGDAALLQFALIQLGLQTVSDKDVLSTIIAENNIDAPSTPFIPVVPPVMIRPDVFQKMARLDPADDRFYISSDDWYLIGSAEHTLGSMFMDTVLAEKDLPLRFIGYSTSFRREAGSYGKDTRGIIRVHQFDKLEMESFSTPEQGRLEQELMIAIQEYLMQQLGIPYQVVEICTGDMGGPDYKQYDIEAWIPSQEKYRETHTADWVTDYQSRRLGTKYQSGDENEYVHMNDATAFAIGRTLVAILENYQQADGSVEVPEVLVPFMGGKTSISP